MTDDKKAEVMHIMGDVKGKTAVIVDDMVATAGSLVEAVEAIKKAGAKEVTPHAPEKPKEVTHEKHIPPKKEEEEFDEDLMSEEYYSRRWQQSLALFKSSIRRIASCGLMKS